MVEKMQPESGATNALDQALGGSRLAGNAASTAPATAISATTSAAHASSTSAARVTTSLGRRRGTKVLPEHARSYNRALLLQTLFHSGAMSRADLSRATGLTRVTVSDLIAGLIEDHLVAEIGVREDSRPGKPAILVDIDYTAHQIVGLDLSGPEGFQGALVTLDGRVLHRATVTVTATDAQAVLAAVVQLARELLAKATAPVVGIGVGTPGIVDDRGVVQAAPNLGWENIDLQGHLSGELGLPVLVANDANTAVLAEYTFGDGGDVMLVKIGRGVGSGIVAGGGRVSGARHAAGELGHVVVGTDGGPTCKCGKVGCLEAWIAAPTLTSRLASLPDDDAAGRAGVLRDAGERLGIVLAPVVAALDLAEVVVAGPQELFGGEFIDSAVQTLRARSQFHDHVTVRLTDYGDDIVLRGAVVMVLNGLLHLL